MTAETILTDVLREIGLSKTSPQLSGTDEDILQIRKFMNDTGKDVARRAEWADTFITKTVAGSVSSETLPDDFYSLAEKGAVWLNKSDWSPVRVIVAPEQWEFINATNSTQPYCHIKGGSIHFAPALDGDGAKYSYVSKNWVTGKEEITENADTLLIPERLVGKGTVARWRRAKGLPYDDYQAEFDADLVTEIKANRGEG